LRTVPKKKKPIDLEHRLSEVPCDAYILFYAARKIW